MEEDDDDEEEEDNDEEEDATEEDGCGDWGKRGTDILLRRLIGLCRLSSLKSVSDENRTLFTNVLLRFSSLPSFSFFPSNDETTSFSFFILLIDVAADLDFQNQNSLCFHRDQCHININRYSEYYLSFYPHS